LMVMMMMMTMTRRYDWELIDYTCLKNIYFYPSLSISPTTFEPISLPLYLCLSI
jgi:hypothetical protein